MREVAELFYAVAVAPFKKLAVHKMKLSWAMLKASLSPSLSLSLPPPLPPSLSFPLVVYLSQSAARIKQL